MRNFVKDSDGTVLELTAVPTNREIGNAVLTALLICLEYDEEGRDAHSKEEIRRRGEHGAPSANVLVTRY